MRKGLLLISVLEAVVLLVMKYASWQENKKRKPIGGKAHSAGGHRVVKPAPAEYNEGDPRGENNHAAYLPAGSSAVDEDVFEKAKRRCKEWELSGGNEVHQSHFSSGYLEGIRNGLDLARRKGKMPADEQSDSSDNRREPSETK